jgi:N-acetylneuraminic acid mutarotase
MEGDKMKSLRAIVYSLVVTACALAATGAAIAGEGATSIGSYRWMNVRPTVPFDPGMWAPRAGLQAVELRNDLYVMGGRGPFSFETETVLYGDVWKSSDVGATWTRVAQWQPGQATPQMWEARAYFGSVTHRGRIFVIGGQNFQTMPNPIFPGGCASLPPGVPCLPIVPNSTFFDDVWSSKDGVTWTAETTDAPWAGRAGLSAVVHDGAIYILGGSQGDDASTGGTGRILFNDVWMSRDGRNWTEVARKGPRWTPRAGAAVVSKGGYLYVLGGERGFSCGFDPASPCQPATQTLYFNDVWRSKDGASWQLVTASAGWSPRPGHQCVVLINQIVCFGGYGEVPGLPPIPANPTDMWTSRDGRAWTQVPPPAAPPWNGQSSADMRYDFDALVFSGGRAGLRPSIMTFGGDRERFGLPSDVNAFLIENDVWQFGP